MVENFPISKLSSGRGDEVSVWLDKAIAAGLIVVIVFTVLAHGVVEPWSVFLFEIAVTVLMLMWVVKAVIDKGLSLRIPPPVWPLAALITFGVAQSVVWEDGAGNRQSLSFDVEATRGAVMILFCLLACSLLASNFLVGPRRMRGLAKFLVIFGGAVGVFGLVQHFAWNGSVYWLRPTKLSPFGPFFNRDHFAGYLELLLSMPVALIVTRHAVGETALFYGVIATMMGVAIIFTLSRAGMLSMLAEMAFLAVVSFKHFRRARAGQALGRGGLPAGVAVVIVITAAIISVVIWIGAGPIINRVATGDARNSDMRKAQRFYDVRGEIWEDTWTMIKHHPLTGVGLGAFATAYPIYARDKGTNWIVAEAHNDYLQILADAGLVGGGLALWFMITIFRAIARSARSSAPLPAGLSLGAGAGLIGLLVHSVFDFNLHLPSHALLFLVLSMTVSNLGDVRDDAPFQRIASATPVPEFVREVSL
jgi:O-antigen ligase